MRIRVVIADWQLLLTDGLELILRSDRGIDIVGRASDSDELLRVIDKTSPDVVVLSRILPKRQGLGVIRQLRQHKSTAAVVLLAAEISEREVNEAIALGVAAVIMKRTCGAEKLRQAVRSAALGARAYDAALLPQPEPLIVPRTERSLSNREIDIARQVAIGLRNREIAEKLFIAESTVKVHLKKIYEKVKVHNRVALSTYAREHGLL